MRTLKQISVEGGNDFPFIAPFLSNDLYMDHGAMNREEWTYLQKSEVSTVTGSAILGW